MLGRGKPEAISYSSRESQPGSLSLFSTHKPGPARPSINTLVMRKPGSGVEMERNTSDGNKGCSFSGL